LMMPTMKVRSPTRPAPNRGGTIDRGPVADKEGSHVLAHLVLVAL
jgi:hypothetical protein